METIDYSGLGNKTDSQLTLEDLKPDDREGGYPIGVPKPYTRLLEMIPGLATWFFLFLPFIAALLGYPSLITYYVVFLVIYWTARGFRFIYGLTVGYNRYKRDVKRNWIKDLQELPPKGTQKMKYVLIYPIVKEGLDVINPAMDAWINQDIGAENISLVFAIEEKFKDEVLSTIETVKKRYGDKFRETMTFVHRNDIHGEVSGVKGANINWATRHFVREIQKRGEELNEYLLITNDSDFRPHRKYLSSITYKYFTVEKPNQKYYTSALYKLTNNLWDVPVFVRTQSAFITLVILHAWVVEKKRRDSFSAYVVSLETVQKVGYWDPSVGIDDTTFYWNARTRFDGDFYGEEVYVPVTSDAVENVNTLATYKALYRQQYRWGAGVIVFPMTFAGFYKNKRVRFSEIWRATYDLLESFIFLFTVVYLMTFALPVLGWLSPEYNFSAQSVILPRLTSGLFLILTSLNIPLYIFKRKILQPPKNWPWWRVLWDVVETLLITVNMLTFTFLPYLQARTELMFGKGWKKEYYATEKFKTERLN